MSRELHCLNALREGRALFFHSIMSHARQNACQPPGKAADDIDLLLSENTYQVAAFYYMVEERHLSERSVIRGCLQRHNEDMTALLADRAKSRLMGLPPQRVRGAIFQPHQIEKVVQNVEVIDGKSRLRLDQSDLGRLLIEVMSAETCRKVIIGLSNAGLLSRINIGSVMIISTGVLESYFRRHLQHIVQLLDSGANK